VFRSAGRRLGIAGGGGGSARVAGLGTRTAFSTIATITQHRIELETEGNVPSLLVLEDSLVFHAASCDDKWNSLSRSHGFIDLLIDRCTGKHCDGQDSSRQDFGYWWEVTVKCSFTKKVGLGVVLRYWLRTG